jgi:hypothetical protein
MVSGAHDYFPGERKAERCRRSEAESAFVSSVWLNEAALRRGKEDSKLRMEGSYW